MEHNYTQHSRLRRGVAALAATLVLAMLQPATPADADTIFTFEGGGFGHSVGMSQYGAFGMALDGFSWQEIVTHYFTDTTVAAADPLFTETPIWVGLTQEKPTVVFTVRAIGPDPVPATITRGNETLEALPGETITIQQLGNNNCRVTTPAGELTGSCSMDIEWDGWEASPTTALELGGCSLPDWNAPGGTVFKPCTYARGTIHVRPDNNTQTVDVALEIDIEDYVLGISESPYGWGSYGGMAALEAQAVAARSYAIHRSVDRGAPENRPWCWCQIYDTPVDQNYVGWGHGTSNWIDAVRNTEDMVLTHPSETHQGVLLPIEAFYSSSSFGWTENSEVGFTAYVPYLRNVDDHWSLDPATGNHSARWTRQFSGSSLAARLPGMSSVSSLEVSACSDSGAAQAITFHGSGGPRTFTTRELRGYLGIRSMQILRAGSPLPDSPACPQPGDGATPPPDPGGPVVLASLDLDDDGFGDSFGNADGNAQCGEIVEMFTPLSNTGAPLTGVAATITSADPYVSIRWNTTSTYPDLDEGETAPNNGDWDLTIADTTPSNHDAQVSLHVVADNGGPWDLDVTFPVSCTTVDAVAAVTIGDIDGNGAPDIATAFRADSGRKFIQASDTTTGEETGLVQIASPAWDVVDIAAMSDGTVAALITRSNTTTHVVIVDLATGAMVNKIKYGRNVPVALAIVPNATEAGDGIAVLFDRGTRSRIITKTITGQRLLIRHVPLDPIAIEAIANIGASPSAELSVLGTRKNGTVSMYTIDATDGIRISTNRFGTNEATALTAFRSANGGGIDRLAVLQSGTDGYTLRAVDPATRSISQAITIPVDNALALETLPSIGGSAGDLVAVYGSSADGRGTAVVVDPLASTIVSQQLFPAGATPLDLTVVAGIGPSGVTLASLGAISATAATISLQDALSGATLGTIAIP